MKRNEGWRKHTLSMVLKNNLVLKIISSVKASAWHLSKHTVGLNFLPLLAETNLTAGCWQSLTRPPSHRALKCSEACQMDGSLAGLDAEASQSSEIISHPNPVFIMQKSKLHQLSDHNSLIHALTRKAAFLNLQSDGCRLWLFCWFF